VRRGGRRGEIGLGEVRVVFLVLVFFLVISIDKDV
jgi:hypothetical protein